MRVKWEMVGVTLRGCLLDRYMHSLGDTKSQLLPKAAVQDSNGDPLDPQVGGSICPGPSKEIPVWVVC